MAAIAPRTVPAAFSIRIVPVGRMAVARLPEGFVRMSRTRTLVSEIVTQIRTVRWMSGAFPLETVQEVSPTGNFVLPNRLEPAKEVPLSSVVPRRTVMVTPVPRPPMTNARGESVNPGEPARPVTLQRLPLGPNSRRRPTYFDRSGMHIS